MTNKYEKLDIGSICRVFNGKYSNLSTKEYSERCEIPVSPFDKSSVYKGIYGLSKVGKRMVDKMIK